MWSWGLYKISCYAESVSPLERMFEVARGHSNDGTVADRNEPAVCAGIVLQRDDESLAFGRMLLIESYTDVASRRRSLRRISASSGVNIASCLIALAIGLELIHAPNHRSRHPLQDVRSGHGRLGTV